MTAMTVCKWFQHKHALCCVLCFLAHYSTQLSPQRFHELKYGMRPKNTKIAQYQLLRQA